MLAGMTRDEFMNTLEAGAPPDSLSPALTALWHDRKGDWDRAHTLCQQMEEPAGSRIHAYLHREEGDIGNAQYWYSRAGAGMPDGTLEQEWDYLVDEVLAGRL